MSDRSTPLATRDSPCPKRPRTASTAALTLAWAGMRLRYSSSYAAMPIMVFMAGGSFSGAFINRLRSHESRISDLRYP